MNPIFAILANAAAARLAEINPDLKLKATLELGPVEARALRDALDDLIIPSLLETIAERGRAGENVNDLISRANVLCRVSLQLGDAIKEVLQGLEAERERLRAEAEDKEIAELRRDLEPAE
jgi:hypothetical protein